MSPSNKLFCGKINIKLITINDERKDLEPKRFQVYLFIQVSNTRASCFKIDKTFLYSLHVKLSLKVALM